MYAAANPATRVTKSRDRKLYFMSWITSMITGHERKTNHLTPARMSAPCASYCYHAIMSRSSSLGSPAFVPSAIQTSAAIQVSHATCKSHRILSGHFLQERRVRQKTHSVRLHEPCPQLVELYSASLVVLPTAYSRPFRQTESCTFVFVVSVFVQVVQASPES